MVGDSLADRYLNIRTIELNFGSSVSKHLGNFRTLCRCGASLTASYIFLNGIMERWNDGILDLKDVHQF
jgi:hypothetical protein